MDIHIDGKSFVRSKTFKGALWVIGIFVVLSLVFKAGEFVGFRKAGFSYRVGEQYFRGMMGPRMGVIKIRGAAPQDFMMGHGTFGRVVSVSSTSLVLQGREGAEQVVLVTSETVINRFRETITVNELKADDNVVIIGSPNDAGQVEARLIRVMPALPPMPSGTVPAF